MIDKMKDGSVKNLKLDIESVYRALVIAALIGGGSFNFSTLASMNAKLNDLSSGYRLTQFQVDLISKKLDGYATRDDLLQISKKTDDYVTKNDIDQRGKMRDMQLGDIDRRINILESRHK